LRILSALLITLGGQGTLSSLELGYAVLLRNVREAVKMFLVMLLNQDQLRAIWPRNNIPIHRPVIS